MKKLFFTLLILLFALPAYAQQCGEENPCPQVAKLGMIMGSTPVAAGGYTWTLVGTRTGYTAAAGANTTATSSTIDIDAGDTLVVWVYAYDAAYAANFTISVSDGGTNSFTMEASVADTGDGANFASFGIVTSASNNDTATFTATFGVTTHTTRSIVVYVLRKSGGTVSKDAVSIVGSSASGVTPTSGNINTVASAYVIGAYGMNQVLSPTNRLLNNSAPTANVDATSSSTWYMNFVGAVSNNHSEATEGSTNNWVAGVYSVKIQ